MNNSWVDPTAISLGTYLLRLFRSHSQKSEALNSPEFLALEKVYGREKLRQVYKAALDKEKAPKVLEAQLVLPPELEEAKE